MKTFKLPPTRKEQYVSDQHYTPADNNNRYKN
jgi:hypothetical protein